MENMQITPIAVPTAVPPTALNRINEYIENHKQWAYGLVMKKDVEKTKKDAEKTDKKENDKVQPPSKDKK